MFPPEHLPCTFPLAPPLFKHFPISWHHRPLQGSPWVFPAAVWNQPLLQGALISLLDNGVRNKDLSARCAYDCWGVLASRSSQWTELGNISMHTNPCTHTSISTSVSGLEWTLWYGWEWRHRYIYFHKAMVSILIPTTGITLAFPFSLFVNFFWQWECGLIH